MKSWQILIVGLMALMAVLSLNAYERFLAGIAAIFIVAAVITGFCIPPKSEVVYVWLTYYARDLSEPEMLNITKQALAVRVELARLWLLFVPTFIAVAFLLASIARGTTWKFSIIQSSEVAGVWFLYLLRFFVFAVSAMLTAWLLERWILRDAEGSLVKSVTPYSATRVYSFVDSAGEYHGGESSLFARPRERELRDVVFYRREYPRFNKLSWGFVFHRFAVIGRGLTDLDAETARAHAVQQMQARPVSH